MRTAGEQRGAFAISRLASAPARPLLLLLLAAISLNGCAGPASGRTRIVLTGSSTVAPLMAEIAKRFEAHHPGVRIDVQTGGSARGLADARQGTADIGMVSRDPKESEHDLEWMPLARDGVAMIVHAENPIERLTRDQVRAIFTGRLRDWQQLEGRAAPITVVTKAEGRSTLEVFLAYFGLETDQIRADVVIGDNQQGIKTVAGDPLAIGYVSIGSAEVERDRGAPISLVPIDGAEPSTEALAAGVYPIARTLHLVTRERPAGVVAELIAYARSPAVSDLVSSLHFVALGST